MLGTDATRKVAWIELEELHAHASLVVEILCPVGEFVVLHEHRPGGAVRINLALASASLAAYANVALHTPRLAGDDDCPSGRLGLRDGDVMLHQKRA